MRLLSFRHDPQRPPQAGALVEDTVLPVVGLMRTARTELGVPVPAQLSGMGGVPMELVLAFWDVAEAPLQAATGHMAAEPDARRDSGFPVEDVTLTGPVTAPPSVRDFYAFEEHVRNARQRRGLEVAKQWYDVPVFYFSNPAAIYGPGEQVPRPAATTKLDFELEVAWIIGREARDIDPDDAWEVIAGLTVMNDWSARDVQAHEMAVGLGPSKGKDFATSLGPHLVTLDELDDRRTGGTLELEMRASINGDPVSQGNLADLHWSIPVMTAHASRDTRLQPGDVLGTGTVGTGSILDLGTEAWLEPGDEVQLTVERLGTLESRVAEPE